MSGKKVSLAERFKDVAGAALTPAKPASSFENIFGKSAPSENLALTEQKNAAHKVFGIDPDEDCIVVGEEGSSKRIGTLIEQMEEKSRLQLFTENAKDQGVLACDLSNGDAIYSGVTIPDENIVGVNTLKSDSTRIAAEEFVHFYQDVTPLDQSYSAQDAFLWHLGIEAQAKLSVAVEAVRQKHEGDPGLYNEHITNQTPSTAPAYYMNKEVMEHGIDALTDPAVLEKSFNLIMNNRDFTADYHDITGNAREAYTGTDQITGTEFSNAFGTIIGGDARQNFLADTVKERGDVIDMVNPDFPDLAWLKTPLSMESTAGKPDVAAILAR